MNKLAATTAVLATAMLSALTITTPAEAVPPFDTPMEVTITGGVLAISVPTTNVNLGSAVNTVNGTTIYGSLGQVQVSDARASAAGSSWTASAISTAFTPPAGPTIGAALVGYKAGLITKVGTAIYTANDPTGLAGVSPVVSATAITGDNSATWTPTISVRVPGSTTAGRYTAVITHSVI